MGASGSSHRWLQRTNINIVTNILFPGLVLSKGRLFPAIPIWPRPSWNNNWDTSWGHFNCAHHVAFVLAPLHPHCPASLGNHTEQHNNKQSLVVMYIANNQQNHHETNTQKPTDRLLGKLHPSSQGKSHREWGRVKLGFVKVRWSPKRISIEPETFLSWLCNHPLPPSLRLPLSPFQLPLFLLSLLSLHTERTICSP